MEESKLYFFTTDSADYSFDLIGENIKDIFR